MRGEKKKTSHAVVVVLCLRRRRRVTSPGFIEHELALARAG
jgi:hypothetical protein